MLKAVIFDCDGVIADSEQLHFSLLRDLVGELGVSLTKEQYLDKYLAMDDKKSFAAVLADNGKSATAEQLQKLRERKSILYKEKASGNLVILPGVVELVMALSQKYVLAVASGALREEVFMALDTAAIKHYFDVVVSAEDVKNGKPAPDSYLLALERLNQKYPAKKIQPAECLVIEDSKHGVDSAHGAGMKCAAVCTSYPAEELKAADLIVPALTAVRASMLAELFK